MANETRYRELLKNLRDSDKAHREAYRAAQSKYGTNRKAHDATEQELEASRKAAQALCRVLEPAEKLFLAGERAGIDEIISFIEADVRAINSGYRKAKYYRRLKQLELTARQIERLKQVALMRCRSTEQHREDNELRRLMIRLADWSLIEQLLAMPDSLDRYVRRRRALMLSVILRGRKDLREKARFLAAPEG
jgi:hypothetical protein